MAEVERIGNIYGEDRGYGFAGNVWNKVGLSPALTTMQGGGREPMIIDKIKKVGQISNEGLQCGTVVSDEGLYPTISAGCHGYANPHILTKQELIPCKLDKMPKGKLTSLNNAKICDVGTKTASTITARYTKGIGAHKDNMCLEIKQPTKEGSIKCKVGGCFDSFYPDSKTRRGRVQEGGDIVPTLTASSSENINYVETVYRIRKLTPRECWRLMGYTDSDFESAQEAGVSNSQLYKQAGNAIVKQVLMAIFKQMNIKSIKETS